MSPKTKPNQVSKPAVPRTDISQREAVSAGKYYLVVSLIMIATVIVGAYFINKLFNQYITESNKIKSQDQTIGLYEQKIEDLAELAPAFKAIKEKKGTYSDSEIILKALPVKEEYRSLIAMMENIAKSSGVKLESISSSSSSGSSSSSSSASSSSSQSTSGASGGSYKTLNFNVGIKGDYDKIIRFLNNTEKSARVIDFKDMKIGSSEDGKEINADLTMVTYWQPEADIKSTEKELGAENKTSKKGLF